MFFSIFHHVTDNSIWAGCGRAGCSLIKWSVVQSSLHVSVSLGQLETASEGSATNVISSFLMSSWHLANAFSVWMSVQMGECDWLVGTLERCHISTVHLPLLFCEGCRTNMWHMASPAASLFFTGRVCEVHGGYSGLPRLCKSPDQPVMVTSATTNLTGFPPTNCVIV